MQDKLNENNKISITLGELGRQREAFKSLIEIIDASMIPGHLMHKTNMGKSFLEYLLNVVDETIKQKTEELENGNTEKTS